MNSLIILYALLVVQGEFSSIYKYKCDSNHVDNQIILSIKNNISYIEELHSNLKKFPINKIELSNYNEEDKFLFYSKRYKLPNGIIVLQEIDYQKYVNGSLSLNDNDSLIN